MTEKTENKTADALVEVTRGTVIERVHRGHAVVIDENKDILYSKGDPYKYSYMRSCAKPVQVLPMVRSGAMEKFGLTQQEMAIMCASHYAEPFHIETLKQIMNKLSVTEADLQCGEATSLKTAYAIELARHQKDNRQLFNDCSGKHLGMLALTLFHGRPVDRYLDYEGETQGEIKNAFAAFCEYPADKISIGIDGCSAPVFALPLYNMALSYLKLSNSNRLPDEDKKAADLIYNAMVNYPEMVSGTDGFCTELIKRSNGKLIGKVGAEGVYCVGVRDRGIALAVKIDDGSMSVLSSIVIELLNKFNVLTSEEKDALEPLRIKENLNDRNMVVGYQRPVVL